MPLCTRPKLRHQLDLFRRAGQALVLGALLAACGQSGTAVPIAESPKAYVATVKLLPTDTAETLGARYGGKVLLFNAKQGVAVVTTNKRGASGSLNAASVSSTQSVESDRDAVHLSATDSVWSLGQFTPVPANSDDWSAIGLETAQRAIPELGASVIIAVIDSGVDTSHYVFKNRLAPSSQWRDLVDNDHLPDEVGAPDDAAFGHGTAVASIATQVSPHALILPLRVIGPSGYGQLSDLVTAVVDAADSGAGVINLSVGTDEPSPALEAAIEYAESAGAIVVAASGNRGLTEIDYPARSAPQSLRELSVGSVNNNLERSSFSNYGVGLEVYAPGEAIGAAAPGERFAIWSGTSMSAPVVAGAVALGLSAGAGNDEVAAALTDTTAPLSGTADNAPGVVDLAAFAQRIAR